MENTRITREAASRDITGAPIFCDGARGRAHVMAHRLLDAGQAERGHRLLGDWLATHEGEGSDWAHLQWHMAVFEIATERWRSAFERFVHEVLPAVYEGEAYTDGPSLLWRLSLTSPGRVEIPWETVCGAALVRLAAADEPYVEAHHLLAFAGAGDASSIERWLSSRKPVDSLPSDHILTRMAEGLSAFARRDYGGAAQALASVAPRVSQLGGSRAQNELFTFICHDARWRAEGASSFAHQRAA